MDTPHNYSRCCRSSVRRRASRSHSASQTQGLQPRHAPWVHEQGVPAHLQCRSASPSLETGSELGITTLTTFRGPHRPRFSCTRPRTSHSSIQQGSHSLDALYIDVLLLDREHRVLSVYGSLRPSSHHRYQLEGINPLELPQEPSPNQHPVTATSFKLTPVAP